MKVFYYGNRNADTVLIQMVGEHDLPLMEREYRCLQEMLSSRCSTWQKNDVPHTSMLEKEDAPQTSMSEKEDASQTSMSEKGNNLRVNKPASELLLAAVLVDNWNDDLSPWPAPPVFGKPPAPREEWFGDGAVRTLDWLLGELIPSLEMPMHEKSGRTPQTKLHETYYLGGYSLAGLFALWAMYQTDLFAGVAAVSPSVWFPNFREYVKTHSLWGTEPSLSSRKQGEAPALQEQKAASSSREQDKPSAPQKQEGASVWNHPAIYLSLGDKEEKTRSQVMAQVGTAIREIYEHLQQSGVSCTLEWNPGNHFAEPEVRMAKGWAWLLLQS